MSLNKVLLIGNLGADPELRFTSSQLPICSFRIATNERRKNAQGDWEDSTEWHSIVSFGKNAEFCSKYLNKGKTILVEGKLRTSKFQDQEGKDRWKTEILADSVKFVGGRGNDAAMPSHSEPMEDTHSAPLAAQIKSSAPARQVSYDDDDIPF